MLIEIGISSLFLAFITSLLGSCLALYGIYSKQSPFILSARNALFATLPLLSLASCILIYAQYTGMYEIAYVNGVSKDSQADLLKITALWGGQAGSLVLWSWMLSLFTVAVLLLNWDDKYHLIPWVMVVTGTTLAFFLLLNNFYENPFERTWLLPQKQNQQEQNIKTALLRPSQNAEIAYPYQYSEGQFFHTEKDAFFPMTPEARYDGRGLSPLLRHPGMIIHPPTLYLGFTGFVIPFAFAIAALARGDLSTNWLKASRRWSLAAWLFLSLGLILGGRWAYDVLGWGGYWGWDPVENSSFLPWLTGTAFLHSLIIQERRGMLKGWNIIMIILTYLLVLFGTVATRTGLLSSVHSFAESPLSTPMGLFLGATVLICMGLFLWRGQQRAFENDHSLESMFSRESLFLFNNWIFLAITVVVFWGTWSELITGMAQDIGLLDNTLSLGPEYYEKIVPWLFILLYILMGVAPLAAWRKASAKKLGIALSLPIALAIVVFIASIILTNEPLIAFGITIIAFSGFATLLEIYKGVKARHKAHGEFWLVALSKLFKRNRRRYGGYLIHLSIVIIGLGITGSTAFQDFAQETVNPGESFDIGPYTIRYDRLIDAIADDDREMVIAEVTLFRNNKKAASLRPRRDFFGRNSSPMTIAGLHSTAENDVYILLTYWEGYQATLRVYRNPLVNFIWWGSIMLILGTIITVYPEPLKKQSTL